MSGYLDGLRFSSVPTSPALAASAGQNRTPAPADTLDYSGLYRVWRLRPRGTALTIVIVTDPTHVTRRRVVGLTVERHPVVNDAGEVVLRFEPKSLLGALLREDTAGLGPARDASAAYAWALARIAPGGAAPAETAPAEGTR